jgi:CRP/FNR family cyclic AMP-dependent transcriptional regulator
MPLMSRPPKTKPIEPSTTLKPASDAPFDPGVFLARAALGCELFKHSKKKVIFAQGEEADAVFYIKKGRVKVAVVSKDGKEAIVALLFMSHILTRNARVEEDLVDQIFNSTEKRLARLLLLMANFGKEGRTEPILAKISQETLAEMIGTTRSRVSHFMNKFRRLGFIDYNGHLRVHNSLVGVLLGDQPRTVSPPEG